MHAKTFASIHEWFPLHTHSTGKGNKTIGKIHDEEKRGLNWHQQVMEVAGSSSSGTWSGRHQQDQIVRTKTVTLCISIGENSCLEQLIVRVVDSRDGDCWEESKLFIFHKEVIDVYVEDHPSKDLISSSQVLVTSSGSKSV
jgi:hypothetical protein